MRFVSKTSFMFSFAKYPTFRVCCRYCYFFFVWGTITIVVIVIIERLFSMSFSICVNFFKELFGITLCLLWYRFLCFLLCISICLDVCTINELLALSQRFEVARMLREQKTYLDIAEKTGASTATISRVNRSLNYGNDGYDLVFNRMSWEGCQMQWTFRKPMVYTYSDCAGTRKCGGHEVW